MLQEFVMILVGIAESLIPFMTFFSISLLIGAIFYAIWDHFGNRVKKTDKLQDKSWNKVVILSESEAIELVQQVRYAGKEKFAMKLLNMIKCKGKLLVVDFGSEYRFGELRPEDTSNDEVQYGGVLFPSGEYIKYDKKGREHRGRIKC